MPQDEEEKRKRKEKEGKKKKRKGTDIFSLFGLAKSLARRRKRFGEETGIDFKTGKDLPKKGK